MALSSAISSALNGIRTSQKALDVVSENVTNVNTEGYNRKSYSQKTLVLNNGQMSGAISNTDLRQVDTKMVAQLRKETGILQASSVRVYYLDLIQAKEYQNNILDKLEKERLYHNSWHNLVVAATGTGKTVIAAFDYKRFREKNTRANFLFVVHREEIIKLKMREAVDCLLNLDEKFYPTLFDFSTYWKIDLLGFMEKNFTQNMSMKEFANYTGRSLATFKRDFSKISDLTPEKWLLQKRLDKAYDLLKSGESTPSGVYAEVGFKNRSHFALAFRKHFGMTPSSVKNSIN